MKTLHLNGLGERGEILIADENDETVALVLDGERIAQLITTSPKMLSALEAVVAAARVSDAELALALDNARSVIAEATS